MATVEKIRNGLIGKICSLKHRFFLEVPEKLFSSNSFESETEDLSKEEEMMSEMNEQDIKSRNLIAQRSDLLFNFEITHALR